MTLLFQPIHSPQLIQALRTHCSLITVSCSFECKGYMFLCIPVAEDPLIPIYVWVGHGEVVYTSHHYFLKVFRLSPFIWTSSSEDLEDSHIGRFIQYMDDLFPNRTKVTRKYHWDPKLRGLGDITLWIVRSRLSNNLGVIFIPGTMTFEPQRIQAMLDIPTPLFKRKVWTFRGLMVNCPFWILGSREIAEHLYESLKDTDNILLLETRTELP